MGFGFTEAQEMFRREIRVFAQREIAPGSASRAKGDHFPPEIIKKMAGMGLLGLNLPEKYGGQPVDWVTLGIAVEEIARADFNLGIVTTLSSGVGLALNLAPDEVQAEWLPPLVKGDILFCLATTEPGIGSDVARMQCRAIRGDGYYILQGEKTSITLGMQAKAGIIFAKTDPTAGAHGVTAFLVPLESPGVTRSRIPDMGCKPMGRASIILDGVKVPEKYRLGDEGKGFYLVMSQFDVIRVCLGLMCMGVAATSLEDAINYAKQRMAFGKPIARFEGVSFKIAEAATLIEAGRLLCYRTLWMKDQGLRHTKESAMCKWWCPKIAVRVIHDALLIHGHFGYSEELPLEQRLRDAIGWELADGSAEIMKLIIARELMGREFLPY